MAYVSGTIPKFTLSHRFGYFEGSPLKFAGEDLTSCSNLVVDPSINRFNSLKSQICFFGESRPSLPASDDVDLYRPFLIEGITASRKAAGLPVDERGIRGIADSILSQLRPAAIAFLAAIEAERNVRKRIESFITELAQLESPMARLQLFGDLHKSLRDPRVAKHFPTDVLNTLLMLCAEHSRSTKARDRLAVMLEMLPKPEGRRRTLASIMHAFAQIFSGRAYTHGPRNDTDWDTKDVFKDAFTAAARVIHNEPAFSPSAASELRKLCAIQHLVTLDGDFACTRFGPTKAKSAASSK